MSLNNRDVMFFVNCVFENDIFTYILLYHFYQSSYQNRLNNSST